MLEQQQTQLVKGLQELYRRLVSNQGWKGSPLQNTSSGHPLTHDILERLDALRVDGHPDVVHFEEDTEKLQRKLIADGATSMQRQESMESDSVHDHISLHDVASPKPYFTDPFAPLGIQFPPTPPQHSPAAAFTNSPAYITPELSMDSTQLQSRQQSWPQPAVSYDQGMGFFTAVSPSMYEDPRSMQRQENPCLPTAPWVDEDLGAFGFNNADLLTRNTLQDIR